MPTNNQLPRQFGLATAVAVIIGQVIAVGIFLTPAGMAKSLGAPFWLLLVWLIMGLMALCGALCFGELAARFPTAGGSYAYLREVYGAKVAFLYGWMVLLVLDPGLTAALAVGLASYVAYLVPLPAWGLKAVGIVTIFLLAIINIVGARIGDKVMRGLTYLKIGTLLFLVFWGFGGGLGDWANFTPFVTRRGGTETLLGDLAGGLMGAFFALAGWWEVSRMAGEIKDPNKNLPRALVLGVAAVTGLYLLTSAVFIYLIPLAQVTDGATFAAQAGAALFGANGGRIFALVVIVAVLGSLAAYLMAAPRVYYAMAQDGLFFRGIAELHPRFGTPHRATLIQTTLAAVLIATGTFEQIISYFFFIVVLFLALTVAGLFIIRRRAPAFDGYRVPLFPLTPLVFLLLVMPVLALIALRSPLQTLLGTGVVLLGWPVYALFFASQNAEARTE